MQKNIFEQLSTEEIKKVNREIIPLFGTSNRITSGSYSKIKGKKMQCNITVGDTSTYNSSESLTRIGKLIKEILNVYEVYSFGTKLA